MPDTPSRPAIALGEPRFFPGYFRGFRQPVLRCPLRIGEIDPSRLRDARLAFLTLLGSPDEAEVGNPSLGDCLGTWPSLLLRAAQHPVFDEPRLLRAGQPGAFVLLQPGLDRRAIRAAVAFVAGVLNSYAAGGPGSAETIRQGYEKLKKALSIGALRGFNQLHFLQAAHELGIPWFRLYGNIFQLGYGSSSRWLDSSFTDRTSKISTGLARDKLLASDLLRRCGLPIAAQSIARSEEEAVDCALRIGYPVVVKPVDLDGGVGVRADLGDEDEVRKAFRAAVEKSERVLVEKHVSGKDYRFQVVNGEVHGVVERSAGGVIGDGRRTVGELVESQNLERRTAKDDRRYLHPIIIDDEAHGQLKRQALTVDSVPEETRFVKLRGACNVAGGGIPRIVPTNEIHPDNLELAIRAARVLRLDVAGIDLLIEDVGRSWTEGESHICEVNAQPQMFSTFHKPMLLQLFRGRPLRIPVVLLLGSASEIREIARRVHEICSMRHLNAGLFSNGVATIGAPRGSSTRTTFTDAVGMFVRDPSLDAMVLHCAEAGELPGSWPMSYCSVLVLSTDETGSESVFSVPRLSSLVRQGGVPEYESLFVPSSCEGPMRDASENRFHGANFRPYDLVGASALDALANDIVNELL